MIISLGICCKIIGYCLKLILINIKYFNKEILIFFKLMEFLSIIRINVMVLSLQLNTILRIFNRRILSYCLLYARHFHGWEVKESMCKHLELMLKCILRKYKWNFKPIELLKVWGFFCILICNFLIVMLNSGLIFAII
jgi:hypothetical protein